MCFSMENNGGIVRAEGMERKVGRRDDGTNEVEFKKPPNLSCLNI